jgi:MEMO1 family protein
MIREAAVAGQFYPAWPEELREQIKYFVDDKADKIDAVGVVSPHAGYIYSGAVAGAVFSRVIVKNTCILIGPNHRGGGKPFSIMTKGSWKTPLGEVQIDTEMAEDILEVSVNVEEDTNAHRYEHSLEVQVPFLQYFKPNVMIVPILLSMADPSVYVEIGKGTGGSYEETRQRCFNCCQQ